MIVMFPVLVAIAAGIIGYSGVTAGLAAAPLVAIAWGMATSRWQAFLVMFGYYLAAGRGLFHGGGVFFAGENTAAAHSFWWGLAVWCGPSIVLALAWVACWNLAAAHWRLLLAVLVVSVPPIGLLGWASPVAAAGVWFPGTSWMGMLLMLGSMTALSRLAQGWRLQ
ncbi:hypothetical protein ACFFU8_08850 [Chromobacterium piscinae]|uniref:hypothetical protein n=1 Tax=Chromobacterium piscinae TaxID=686831 RepID=UPI001E600EC0|nr:hypothetical protein [Chromobacterium piscinae]MCD5327988.1 hypothetical protein [Chromobacterium piscinae]